MATVIKLVCKHCSNEFHVKKGRETMFCSKECKLNFREKNDEKYYIEKPCERCGIIFRSKKKFNTRYCSRLCSDEAKKINSRETRKCLICGELFVEKITHERMFCSEKCRVEWQARPENIILRIKATQKAVFEKYGVDNTFQIEEVRLKALGNLRKTYKIRGAEIHKNILAKLEIKRQLALSKKFEESGYKILEFINENIKVLHPDGHVFIGNRKQINNRLNHNVELSTTIQPIGSPRTTFERKLCNFLKESNITYIPNDRKTIGLELDIYIPDYRLAIEIDGLYWHSEYYIDDDYHIKKTKMCEEKNIQLLHFFEDELLEKYDVILSIIKNKLNLTSHKIFARKCIIREIDSKTSLEFLNNNHIQGNVNSSIKIGLFNNNELISLMTFGKLRNVLGNKTKNDENDYEMLRFCNKINHSNIGAASKLFKYFLLHYIPKTVITFANKRYSNGNLYKQLKFEYLYTTSPNYWYVVGKERKHRFLFRKDVLVTNGFDNSKTEHEIMLERKIPRIYDCGNNKYMFINNI